MNLGNATKNKQPIRFFSLLGHAVDNNIVGCTGTSVHDFTLSQVVLCYILLVHEDLLQQLSPCSTAAECCPLTVPCVQSAENSRECAARQPVHHQPQAARVWGGVWRICRCGPEPPHGLEAPCVYFGEGPPDQRGVEPYSPHVVLSAKH